MSSGSTGSPGGAAARASLKARRVAGLRPISPVRSAERSYRSPPLPPVTSPALVARRPRSPAAAGWSAVSASASAGVRPRSARVTVTVWPAGPTMKSQSPAVPAWRGDRGGRRRVQGGRRRDEARARGVRRQRSRGHVRESTARPSWIPPGRRGRCAAGSAPAGGSARQRRPSPGRRCRRGPRRGGAPRRPPAGRRSCRRRREDPRWRPVWVSSRVTGNGLLRQHPHAVADPAAGVLGAHGIGPAQRLDVLGAGDDPFHFAAHGLRQVRAVADFGGDPARGPRGA